MKKKKEKKIAERTIELLKMEGFLKDIDNLDEITLRLKRETYDDALNIDSNLVVQISIEYE